MVGLVLGVASLIVSMAVVSGYETTLKNAVIDVTGHLLVMKRGQSLSGEDEVQEKVIPLIESYVSHTPFVVVEAILAHNKKVNGVLVEGVDKDKINEVLKLQSRLVSGQFDLGYTDDLPNALVGKDLAKKFNLKIGDRFRVVIPQSTGYNSEQFRAKSQRFRLVGTLDLGRYDYDIRYILTNLTAVQDFAELNNQVTGIRVRVEDSEKALQSALKIKNDVDTPYWARSWREANQNLFDAVLYEKPIIFFVVFIIVLAAGFNISSTLFVSVMKRYSDISVLKALGANRFFVLRVFTWQGLFIGVIGSFCGFLLGIAICWLLMVVQDKFGILPAEVYKIAKIEVDLRWSDAVMILLISILVCFVSTLAPALRGANLKPVEGLRYE